jgi:hypothetical protein
MEFGKRRIAYQHNLSGFREPSFCHLDQGRHLSLVRQVDIVRQRKNDSSRSFGMTESGQSPVVDRSEPKV